MSRRHTPATRRIQARLERWELQHLRALAAQQAEALERQAARIAELNQQLQDMEDANEWRHRELMDLGHRMEEAGTGHLGLTRSGALCVLVGGPPELGLSS